MKLMNCGPGGVLENLIALTGFDNLCMMTYDDPELLYDDIIDDIDYDGKHFYEDTILPVGDAYDKLKGELHGYD